MRGLVRVRAELLRLEADREALRLAGLKSAKLDRIIDAKRRTFALLSELAADLGPGSERLRLPVGF